MEGRLQLRQKMKKLRHSDWPVPYFLALEQI